MTAATELPRTAVKICRDTEGDLWARTEDGRVWLSYASPWEGPASRTWEEVETTYGPLVELPEEEAAAHLPAVTELAGRIAPRSFTP